MNHQGDRVEIFHLFFTLNLHDLQFRCRRLVQHRRYHPHRHKSHRSERFRWCHPPSHWPNRPESHPSHPSHIRKAICNSVEIGKAIPTPISETVESCPSPCKKPSVSKVTPVPFTKTSTSLQPSRKPSAEASILPKPSQKPNNQLLSSSLCCALLYLYKMHC
jgi:hypothetical protein